MPQSDVVARARERGVTEVLHFTTHVGLAGVLADGAVHSRDQLKVSEYLESLVVYNSPDRSRDRDWTNYVNLSLSRVNIRMLNSSVRWHEDLWFAVLAFDVGILGHDGVQFATTNNAYESKVKRGPGLEGFEEIFGPRIPWGPYSSVHYRTADMPTNLPTDPQAEILYPESVSIDHLRAIYVRDAEHLGEIAAFRAAFDRTSPHDLSQVSVEHNPSVFV